MLWLANWIGIDTLPLLSAIAKPYSWLDFKSEEFTDPPIKYGTLWPDEYDVLTYTEHDPRVYKPKMMPNTPDMTVTESDIYDPRFNGYGTSYRAYTDENIGQTRFYYDDINSVRMPNYIVRSNIDFANYS